MAHEFAARNAVPLVLIEEHHEAYYVWRYAASAGWMAAKGNVLLHIDEHHDLWRPVLTRPLNSLKNLVDVAHFTYQDLRIGSFICPAVYEGIFDSMLWMRYGYEKEVETRLWSVWPKDELELEFVNKAHAPGDNLALPRTATTLRLISVGPRDRVYPDHSFVLDIDLDYFACNKKPDWKLEVEITASAYDEFCANPYHILRLPSDKVLARKRNGSYFLVFNDNNTNMNDSASEQTEVASIDERADQFLRYLKELPAVPSFICVCRSVYSGYTPRKHARYVEERIIDAVSSRFPIHRLTLAEIVPEEAALAKLIAC